MSRYGEDSIEDVAWEKGALKVQVAFEDEREVACLEVVSQKPETDVKKVVEACW